MLASHGLNIVAIKHPPADAVIELPH
jgi:hypothetical protein